MQKICSLFSGVGGIELGFLQTGKCEVVYANEFDKYAVRTYENNFDLKVDCRDIHEVQLSDIPQFDILVGGFPCTSFSVAGYRKGFDDDRTGDLFFEMERIFRERRPRVVFIENVKNLVGHDDGNTFRTVMDRLEKAGYGDKITYQVMNACEYGNVPQNRERVYIVAFRDKADYRNFEMPAQIPLEKTIKDVLLFDTKVDDKYYYTEGKYPGEMYGMLQKEMDDDTTIYQWRRKYVRKNKNNLIPTLTANMGEGGHNVPLIKTKYGIRKLTPIECFYAQGFPKSFALPCDVNDSRLYKQAGNSVVVPVINRIADNVVCALEKTETLNCSGFSDTVVLNFTEGAKPY
ncbi:MAG: DNA cytosine methyltransferase [Bacteroidales bacterium]|nr:DNA cytosine methyltransferase [Bacteroidales bacterium]